MGEDSTEILAAGAPFGRYTIVRPIGSGGMGAVYEATHNQLRKRVAIKTLHREIAGRSDVMVRFIREGEAASRLRHPHVVDVSDVGVENGVPYLVMEYLEGVDLGAAITERGPTPFAITEILSWLLPVCAAVSAAHHEGIVHRDLKPANIFLSRTRIGTVVPKLLDFGISKLSEPQSNAKVTNTATMLGTACYMSPEQAMGARYAGPASDQYALGVILYECVTGRRPYQDFEHTDSLYQLLHAVVQGQFAPPSQYRLGLPPGLEQVILRAMAREPTARFGSVADLGQALMAFADDKTRETWLPTFGAPTPTPAALPGWSVAPGATGRYPNAVPGGAGSQAAPATISGVSADVVMASGPGRRLQVTGVVLGAAIAAVMGVGVIIAASHAAKRSSAVGLTPAPAAVSHGALTIPRAAPAAADVPTTVIPATATAAASPEASEATALGAGQPAPANSPSAHEQRPAVRANGARGSSSGSGVRESGSHPARSSPARSSPARSQPARRFVD